MVTKYKRLDAQLGDVQFQYFLNFCLLNSSWILIMLSFLRLNAAATTETLVNIMKGMG